MRISHGLHGIDSRIQSMCSLKICITALYVVKYAVQFESVYKYLSVDIFCCNLSNTEYDDIPSKVAGRVPRGDDHSSLNLDRCISTADQKTMSLASSYALVAAEEALKMAKWKPQSEVDRCRSGKVRPSAPSSHIFDS